MGTLTSTSIYISLWMSFSPVLITLYFSRPFAIHHVPADHSFFVADLANSFTDQGTHFYLLFRGNESFIVTNEYFYDLISLWAL